MSRRITLALALCLAAAASAQEKVPYRSPEVAACKSVLIPGWGQFSNGDANRGVALLAVGTVGVLLGTATIGVADTPRRIETERGLGWMLYGLSVVWGGVDAYQRADEINRENGYEVGLLQVDWNPVGANAQLTLVRVRFGGP